MIETKFKNTEIGRVPLDWGLEKLLKNFEFKANNTLSRDALSKSGKIQNIHYGDVLVKYGSHLDVQKESIPFISDERYKTSNYLSDGDVIIADTAEDETVGKATEVLNIGNNKLVSGLHTMWLHPINPERYALGFLGYAFNANIYHNQLLPLIQGTKVSSISKSAIKNTFILLPPKNEQRKITQSLSYIDNLISELGKLIDKKKAIKLGAIQKLITGKIRLDDFKNNKGYKQSAIGEIPVDWELKPVSNVAENYTGLTYTPNDVSDYGTLVLRSSNIQDSRLAFDDNVFVNMEIPKRAIARKDDILICVRNGSSDLIGKCAYITPDADGMAFGAFMTVLRATNIDSKYLFYVWQDVNTQKQIHETFGATINQITSKDFKRILIAIPSDPNEQSAIALSLSSMDKEISSLVEKREKYIAIKQGMMQQLLTGKIRLL